MAINSNINTTEFTKMPVRSPTPGPAPPMESAESVFSVFTSSESGILSPKPLRTLSIPALTSMASEMRPASPTMPATLAELVAESDPLPRTPDPTRKAPGPPEIPEPIRTPQALPRHSGLSVYAMPVLPPVKHLFRDLWLQLQKGDSTTSRSVRQHIIRERYGYLVNDSVRKNWECSFMGYFCWVPGSQGSTEDLCRWTVERGHRRKWKNFWSRVFFDRIVSQMDDDFWLPRESLTNEFTEFLRQGFLSNGIYNIMVVKFNRDWYAVIPVGTSRPTYYSEAFSELERDLINTHYRLYFNRGPEQDDAEYAYLEDEVRITDLLEDVYVSELGSA